MLFGATIFTSAVLLFVVQLTMGKFILPRFGGAPAVWTTCVLFFQILLLFGYAYAHWIASRFTMKRQVQIHLSLLGVSVIYLAVIVSQWNSPILPPSSWTPVDLERPVLEIMRLLGIAVGLPYFLLSATSPLLQRWFADRSGDKPYRLYAISNAGSMLGLLGYPFLIEPLIGLSTQAIGWGFGYVLFATGCGACALTMLKSARSSVNKTLITDDGLRPTSLTILLWLALTATTSAMFLAITNRLCQDVAVVPFLWVVPLAVYLLSFIFCFESDRWYRRRWFILATAAASLWLLHDAQRLPHSIPAQIWSHLTFLFLFCMTGHGELVRLKPSPRHLTLFYLAVAFGGVLGGVFVGLIAPMIFNGYHEFHLLLFGGWILLAIVLFRDRSSPFHTGEPWQFACLLLVTLIPVLTFGLEFTPLRHTVFYWKHLQLITYSTATVLTLATLALTRRRKLARWKYWPRVLVGGMILYAGNQFQLRINGNTGDTLAVTRNFYGVVRVVRSSLRNDQSSLRYVQLTHGQVNHGIQFLEQPFRDSPVSYYAKGSGIELALRQNPRRQSGQTMRVGVLGLGVGTIAAFAQEGDAVTFYEINPEVSAYSSGPEPFFTYVHDCKGKADIRLGDGRMLLKDELDAGNPGQYDVLALDAFSGDSVPVHLLTVEAFEIYLRHLRDDDSIIAANISNQYLNLHPLMSGLATHFGLHAVVIDSPGTPPDKTGSRWCLLTRNADLLDSEVFEKAKTKPQPDKEVLWTDDFSNLFQLLR